MKLDRLIGILSVLLQCDRITAPELARRFEVSRRTINRDIEALCRAGIPIAAARGARGGIFIMEGYRLDRTLLTRSDMRAILAGLRSLDSVSGTNRYALLMEKMSVGASSMIAGDDHILINLASWHGGALAKKIELVQLAIETARTVRFRYHAPDGESTREVEPSHLVFQWSSWYLWGWCRDRSACRLFKLNRMTAMEFGEGCDRREMPLPDLSTERVFPARYDVQAAIDPKYRWRLIEEYGEDCYVERADGRLLFAHGFTDRDQVITWILSFQDGAELLAPEELRGALRAIAARLAQLYDAKAEAL